MHAEAADEPDEKSSINSVGTDFNTGHVGDIAVDEIRRIQAEINECLDLVIRYIPHLTNKHSAGVQRQQAEVHLVHLQKRLEELGLALPKPLSMITHLQYQIVSLVT